MRKQFQTTLQRGKETITIVAHPSEGARAIIVNYPGYRGHIDGYNNKYKVLAAHLAKENVGAIIRMPNIEREREEYGVGLIEDLRLVMRYALENTPHLCAVKKPDLYLMGFSAGAGAVAACANDHSAVKKILLMAPSGDAAQETVKKSLAAFRGEVFVVIGEEDDVVGPDSGSAFFDMATAASRRELVVIPNCDHQFRGTVNGKILSKAPLWAFAGDKTFPSPEGGLELY